MATALEDIADVTDTPRNDRADLNPEAPAVPARYAVREIGFAMVNGKLQFAFKSDELAAPLPPGGIGAVVAALLAPPPPAALALGPGAGPAAAPTTPLDLDVAGGPVWLIYMLAEPGNMRFSATLKAMTHKRSEDRPYYGRLRHATEAGESSQPLAGCRLIYLAAAPPAVDYRHGFNFNVEFEQDSTIEGIPRSLSMEIDPDIRHPGGSTI